MDHCQMMERLAGHGWPEATTSPVLASYEWNEPLSCFGMPGENDDWVRVQCRTFDVVVSYDVRECITMIGLASVKNLTVDDFTQRMRMVSSKALHEILDGRTWGTLWHFILSLPTYSTIPLHGLGSCINLPGSGSWFAWIRDSDGLRWTCNTKRSVMHVDNKFELRTPA